MPRLTVAGKASAPSRRSRSRSRSAKATAPSVPVFGSRIANSSPWRRAATSISRRISSRIAAPIPFSTSFPASCPCASFTDLKSSTSSISAEIGWR
jgi:hypothetical protein